MNTSNTKAPLQGLTSEQAGERLKQFGPNSVAETRQNPLLAFLKKLWAPVPWMLEVTILLELYLGKNVEAVVIAALLIFNAILSFFQENRAQNALTLLRQRLTVQQIIFRINRTPPLRKGHERKTSNRPKNDRTSVQMP